MPRFKVNGTIIKVIDNKFLIRVDEDCCQVLSAIKETIKDPNTNGHFLSVNFKRAAFNIKNLNWNEPTDLIGVRVAVTCNHSTRNIRQKLDIPPSKSDVIPEYIYKNVISYSAIDIKNIQ